MISDSPGLVGIHRGMNNLNTFANRIANYGTEQGARDISGVAEDVVGLKESEFQVKASVKALESEYRAVGSLLDIMA